MNEFMLYINTLKSIVDRHYEREEVFYNNGQWYSRYHSRDITQEELVEWVMEITERDKEYYE